MRTPQECVLLVLECCMGHKDSLTFTEYLWLFRSSSTFWPKNNYSFSFWRLVIHWGDICCPLSQGWLEISGEIFQEIPVCPAHLGRCFLFRAPPIPWTRNPIHAFTQCESGALILHIYYFAPSLLVSVRRMPVLKRTFIHFLSPPMFRLFLGRGWIRLWLCVTG